MVTAADLAVWIPALVLGIALVVVIGRVVIAAFDRNDPDRETAVLTVVILVFVGLLGCLAWGLNSGGGAPW